MPNRGPIPTRDDDRNVYFNSAIPYLHTHKARLVVSDDNDSALTDSLEEWNVTFPKSQDPNQSTKTIREDKDDLIDVIEDTLRQVYADIPQSALTTADRNTLNLKERDTNPSPRPAITVAPIAKVTGTAGARIDYIFRTDTDSNRASKQKDSDGVEIVYTIGTAVPASPLECSKSVFTSKAKGIIEAQIGDAGKKLYGYARWKNNSDNSKSGPWSQLFSTVISD
jgi:hypothetical protein